MINLAHRFRIKNAKSHAAQSRTLMACARILLPLFLVAGVQHGRREWLNFICNLHKIPIECERACERARASSKPVDSRVACARPFDMWKWTVCAECVAWDNVASECVCVSVSILSRIENRHIAVNWECNGAVDDDDDLCALCGCHGRLPDCASKNLFNLLWKLKQ